MRIITTYICLFLTLTFNFNSSLTAQSNDRHVVSLAEMRAELAQRATKRSADLEEVREFLRQEVIQQQAGQLVNLEKIELSLATLDDQTLNGFAEECRQVNDQIEAGLSTVSWIVIAVLLVVVVSIILALAGYHSH